MEKEKHGRLTVTSIFKKRGRKYAACVCECGEKLERRYDHLLRTENSSCGCLKGKGSTKHNFSRTPTYSTWSCMKDRCTRKRHLRYPSYGGVGIKVCQEWMESFESFLADMGERPKGKTLDRIDSTGNYCKENCRWATVEEQNNNRQDSVRVEYKGERYTVKELAEMLNKTTWQIRGEFDVIRLYKQ